MSKKSLLRHFYSQWGNPPIFSALCATTNYLSHLNWMRLKLNAYSDQTTQNVCITSLEKSSLLTENNTSCLKHPCLKFERAIFPNGILTFSNSHHTPSEAKWFPITAISWVPGYFLPIYLHLRQFFFLSYHLEPQELLTTCTKQYPELYFWYNICSAFRGNSSTLQFSKINREKNILHCFLDILNV